MNEDTLRAMIRQSIARQQGTRPGLERPSGSTQPITMHASHYRYALPESGGPCLIEPGVQCNHCGYCQSHGH